jgi:hypothetical protein
MKNAIDFISNYGNSIIEEGSKSKKSNNTPKINN